MLHGIIPLNYIEADKPNEPNAKDVLQPPIPLPYPIPTVHLTVIFTIPVVFRLAFFGGDVDGKVVSTNNVNNVTPTPTDLVCGVHVTPEEWYYVHFSLGSYAISQKHLILPEPTIPQPQPVIIPGPKPRLDRQ
jgi:hypothetical protein